MKVLVVGSGGREHAICWGISENKNVRSLFCAPGNGGISKIAKNVEIKSDDLERLLKFALKEKIDLTIVGPEKPLSLGIVDLFRKNNLLIFGPDKYSSQLESSKEFSKLFMKRHKIPTATFETFTDFDKAYDFIEKNNYPLVIKADGLASGKGVRVCNNFNEAEEFLIFLMKDKIFSKSGEKVVIESFLEGEEASFFVFTDGVNILPLDSSQDHKRLLDQDLGPNTGGMGAYSPAPIIDDETKQNIMNNIVNPVFEGFKKDKINYTGILYIGLMIKNKIPSVVEFNCRFGDPETQPLLYRMKSDIFDLFYKTSTQNLSTYNLEWKETSSVTVVLASKGYPEKSTNGVISNLEKFQEEGVYIFHAGTELKDDNYLIVGGRVLGVTSEHETLSGAINLAYKAISKIDTTSLAYRNDIGKKGLSRNPKTP
ncbi:MAG: phosphoribosylamine--glycine ligase [Thermodesulfobacteriota bacterium]|nr:phosphoribosylamine--glycine ligase [Thermodesulfobacteriota bacterium]|tara:strand:- start:14334 stop:15614 length:1281 start_codon:yes stop_codon:yes gene_type:complete